MPPYIQPGGELSRDTPEEDACGCPFGPETARRIGSNLFSWRCSQGHQFHLVPNGPALLLSNYPTIGLTNGVIDVRQT